MVCNFLKNAGEPQMKNNKEPLKHLVKLMTKDFIATSLMKNIFYYIGFIGQEDTHVDEPKAKIQKEV